MQYCMIPKQRHILTALLIVCQLVALAQKPEFYANGQVKAEGKYKNDQKTGDWTYYREDGTISLKETYNRKAPNMKTVEFFHPNGKTSATGTYINNLKYETWTWYREDGTIDQIGTYMKDKPFGRFSYYDKKGVLKEKGEIIDGLKHGEWEYYYVNGKLLKKGVYKKGKAIGEWEEFDFNGVYENTTVYPDEFDEIQFYNPTKGNPLYATSEGNVPYTKNYPNGKPEVVGQKYRGFNDGNWTWYYDNGQLKETGSFKDAAPTGVWKTYYPTGALRSEGKLFKTGYSSDLVIYHPNGKVRFKKIENTKYEHYYKTGELYMIEHRMLGLTTNRAYYNKSGKLMKADNEIKTITPQ